MTSYDHLLPAASKLVQGLAAKPGIHIANKQMATDWVAQALHGMFERNELPTIPKPEVKKGRP